MVNRNKKLQGSTITFSQPGSVMHLETPKARGSCVERIETFKQQVLRLLVQPTRVGLPEDFASRRLATALARFVKRNPGVGMIINTGLSSDLFRELDENK